MKGWGTGVNMIRVLCGHDTMIALVVTLTHALFLFHYFGIGLDYPWRTVTLYMSGFPIICDGVIE